ncbi:c-type cytochrome biogenesis protein CcsB [Synechococcus sp. PCC 6312]|uniref:c-type cytochrome biogenesis protein CcsB n=1 Tax=Synechococcus sp. (strain ATCC 27167 / PCC 6312) TaxID=195253 RepID=UPI00029EEF88|nr:c-type cytochrome biogenesis protein CcsB [Synechococcus sp. PCC 6312]AFY60516.1 cytochrome c-type biogenesis protein CcsB [Synechococcus sp. PCC 6312]
MDLVTLENWLDNTVFGILFVTMLIYWIGAAFREQGQWLAGLGRTGMILANLCLVGLLGARWIEGGYFPISNLYESLFFLCWGLTLMHLVAEGISGNRLVGVVTAPLAMGIAAFATLTLPPEMQTSAPLVPALKSNWLMMHVSVMMLSYATLMVGSLVAIAFLIVTWGKSVELKGNSIGSGGFRKLGTKTTLVSLTGADSEPELAGTKAGGTAVLTPTLATTPAMSLGLERLTLAETLDNLSYRMIGLGFPLLTIGIISGAVWANEAWGAPWSWDPKETWALITWLVFAAYLHARITKGWQGRKPAIIATCGLGVVWVCYLGVNLLGKGLHSYGWFF